MSDNNSNNKPKLDLKALADKIAKVSEFVEHNLMVLQKTETKIDDLKDDRHKELLKYLYGQMRFKKDFAFASLMKALLLQNKVFFSITKDKVALAVENDPDNPNKGSSFELGPICAQFAKLGIVQLWDGAKSTKKDERLVAGYVVANPDILSLLSVDNTLALQQFEELKNYAKNDWFPKELVFNSCGELRVASDDIRVLIEGRRTKSSESRAVTVETPNAQPQEKVESKILYKLDLFFDDGRVTEIDDKFAEARLGVGSMTDYFEQSLLPELWEHLSEYELDLHTFTDALAETFKRKALPAQRSALLTKVILEAGKGN